MKGILVFILFFAFIQMTYSQDNTLFKSQAKTEVGLVFSMAETGSGFGIFMALPTNIFYHIGITADVYFLRDSKQINYTDYYGYQRVINKENDVYIFDLMATLKKRLFAEDIHDDFRPFITGGLGPVFGINFPEDDRLPNQKELTFGGFVGVGADITTSEKFFISVCTQYRIFPFFNPLGEATNHSMFEMQIKIGKRF